MAVPNRGLKNIRTLSGRVDQCALPSHAYMQITCLEMEKARRNTERTSAAQRISEIDRRLLEIEKEKQELLEAISGHGGKKPPRLGRLEVKASPARRSGGFRIRY